MPLPNKTRPTPPTPPHPKKMSLTHSLCTTTYQKNKNKKNLPPHSSFYIFAHVESGWFVIYLSKLSAASSLVMRTPDPFLTPSHPLPHDQSQPAPPVHALPGWWLFKVFVLDDIERFIINVMHFYMTTHGLKCCLFNSIENFRKHLLHFAHVGLV